MTVPYLPPPPCSVPDVAVARAAHRSRAPRAPTRRGHTAAVAKRLTRRVVLALTAHEPGSSVAPSVQCLKVSMPKRKARCRPVRPQPKEVQSAKAPLYPQDIVAVHQIA